MSGFLIALIVLGALATVAALGRGLYFLANGKDVTGKQQNKMMWYRIAFQGITVLLVIIFVAMSRNS
jgi:Hypoxia induced protein conserved region